MYMIPNFKTVLILSFPDFFASNRFFQTKNQLNLIGMGKLKLLYFGCGAPELFLTDIVHLRGKGDGFENSLRNIASHQGLAYLVSPQVGSFWKTVVMLQNPLLKVNKWRGYKNLKNSNFNAYINFEIEDKSTQEVQNWQEFVSYPGLRLRMLRSQKIKVKYQTQQKFDQIREQVKGFEAKIFQQAYDYLDAVDPLSIATQIQIISQDLRKQHGQKIKELFTHYLQERTERLQSQALKKENNIYARTRSFNELRRQIVFTITDFYRK